MNVGYSAMIIIMERTEGLLDRTWIAGVTPGEFALAHFLVSLVVNLLQVAVTLVFMILIFQVSEVYCFFCIIHSHLTFSIVFFCPLSAPLLINFSFRSFIFSFNSDSILPEIDDLISLKTFTFLFICHSIGQQALQINNSVSPIFYVYILCLSGMYVA